MLRHILVILVLGAALPCGCSLVDEDRSHCEVPFQLHYRVEGEPRFEAELAHVLGDPSQHEMQQLLRAYLQRILPDQASSLDLSFYDAAVPCPLLLHLQETMNGGKRDFTYTMPIHDYRHTAAAFTGSSPSVTLEDADVRESARLVHAVSEGKAVPHTAGLLTARKDFSVKGVGDRSVDVPLYMANSASALVLDMSGAGTDVRSVSVMVSGAATEFLLADSTYVFTPQALVMTDELVSADGLTKGFASVHFPSEAAGWAWKAHVTMRDGKVNESVLHMTEPLLPGVLKVLCAKVTDTGVVTPDDMAVAVTITLDWDPGLDMEVPL